MKSNEFNQKFICSRRLANTVAVTPVAMQLEKKALEFEMAGKFRVASTYWLKCLDAAQGDKERARIAIRRDQCITLGMGLRRGEYSGICNRGVVYD